MAAANNNYINLPRLFPDGKFTELSVDSSTIAFEDSDPTGSSSNLVAYCVPGIGDFRHSYRFLAPTLKNAGFRVIAQDMRGLGDSGTEFADYTIELITKDITTVLDECRITTPVVLFVNSLSAACAVTLAADHPDRIAAIVALGGVFRDMPKHIYLRPMSYILFNQWWGPSVCLAAFKKLFVRFPADWSEYLMAIKTKTSSNPKHASIIGTMIRAPKEYAWAKIERVTCPVLLIMGSNDPDFNDPLQETNSVASHLTKSRLVETAMFDQTGHYPHVEDPEKAAQVILAFLNKAGIISE